jgi:hypothetical protein
VVSCANIRREHQASFHVWQHSIVPMVGTLLLIPVMFVTVRPLPPYPFNLALYLFAILMIVGFAVMKVVEAAQPEALARGSSTFISAMEEAEPQVG